MRDQGGRGWLGLGVGAIVLPSNRILVGQQPHPKQFEVNRSHAGIPAWRSAGIPIVPARAPSWEQLGGPGRRRSPAARPRASTRWLPALTSGIPQGGGRSHWARARLNTVRAGPSRSRSVSPARRARAPVGRSAGLSSIRPATSAPYQGSPRGVLPNPCLQADGRRGRRLTSRDRAPMLVGGRRGRLVPCGARR